MFDVESSDIYMTVRISYVYIFYFVFIYYVFDEMLFLFKLRYINMTANYYLFIHTECLESLKNVPYVQIVKNVSILSRHSANIVSL